MMIPLAERMGDAASSRPGIELGGAVKALTAID